MWCSGWRLCCCCKQCGRAGLARRRFGCIPNVAEHIRNGREYASCFWCEYSLDVSPDRRDNADCGRRGSEDCIYICRQPERNGTGWLHERGITVVHVVSSSRFAVKAEEAGVDAIVAEASKPVGTMGGRRLPPVPDTSCTCSYYTSADCRRWHCNG